MTTFILRRLLLAIPVLLGIMAVTFFLARLIPGDPCTAILGERATPEICAAYFQRYGLDKSLPEQFVIYMRNVIVEGDLGSSLRYGRTVGDLLIERLPVTIELAVSSMIFSVLLGVPLGILAAYRRNSAADVATMVGANIGVSMPVFWLGLMLAYIFGVILKDTPFALPPSGRLSPGIEVIPYFVSWGIATPETANNFQIFVSRLNILNGLLTFDFPLIVDAFRHLIIPSVAVGTISLSIIARMTRSSLLEVLGLDYVRTARAKGLREVTVVMRHAVRNSLLPVVTIIGLSLGSLISGAVLTETIFGLAGVGRTLVDGITARDYSLVQGFTLVIAAVFVVVNLIVDVLYAYLDPRIRLN